MEYFNPKLFEQSFPVSKNGTKYSPFPDESVRGLISYSTSVYFLVPQQQFLQDFINNLLVASTEKLPLLTSVAVHLYRSKRQFLLLDCKLFEAYTRAIYLRVSTRPNRGQDTQEIVSMLWKRRRCYGLSKQNKTKQNKNTHLKENLENRDKFKKHM